MGNDSARASVQMQPSQELIENIKENYGFHDHIYQWFGHNHFIGYCYNLKTNTLNLSSKEIEYFYTNGISEHEAERILILEIKQGIK